MLFDGLRLLLSNWRLTLVQVLPAMWIWAAMLDLKLHLLHGESFRVIRGPVVIPVMLGVVAITMASFFLNAVFAFAIARPGPPKIRPAFTTARSHAGVVLGWGTGVGLLLGFATVIVVRWGLGWFALSLSIVLGIMMVCYVTVPARLIGVTATRSRRDKFTTAAVGGALGAVVCAPPYLLGRVGILMLGSHTLFFLGIILLCVGGALEAGAEGTVKAVKVSANRRPHQPRWRPGRPPGVAQQAGCGLHHASNRNRHEPRTRAPVARDARFRRRVLCILVAYRRAIRGLTDGGAADR